MLFTGFFYPIKNSVTPVFLAVIQKAEVYISALNFIGLKEAWPSILAYLIRPAINKQF